MRVTGPDWPSTQRLRDALKDFEGPDIHWGQGGKNAIQQLQAFKDAGLSAPEFTTDVNTAKQWVRSGLRVFGRRLHHTQGNDIVGAGYRKATTSTQEPRRFKTKRGNIVTRPGATKSSPEKFNPQWLQRDFWVKVIPSSAEYRQHVWGEKCIRVGKKIEAGEHWRVNPVRSRNNGWHLDYGFKSEGAEFTQNLRDVARKAVAALGYPGGAVDILQGSDGRLYVLEVNSAPALTDDNTLGAYVKAITKKPKTKKR